jgi:hypothetical protein
MAVAIAAKEVTTEFANKTEKQPDVADCVGRHETTSSPTETPNAVSQLTDGNRAQVQGG